MTTQLQTELHPAITLILKELGTGSTDLEKEAYRLFSEGIYDSVKTLPMSDLSNSYLRAMAYLCSAVTVSKASNQSNLPTVLSEAARATADARKEATLNKLSAQLSELHSV